MRGRGLFHVTVLIGWTVLAGAANADAAIITAFGDINSPGSSTIGPVGLTPAPNNDNSTASPNVIPAQVFFNNLGPLEIEFVVENSGGTTEYAFSQNFINVNTVPWLGFNFELGFGTGDDFVPLTGGGGLDFDLPNADPLPTSSAYTVLDHQATTIGWTGGVVNPIVGGPSAPFSVAFAFAIDVPDGLALLHPQGLNRFTIRQTPITSTAPEPATAALLAMGLGIAGLRGRRRR
jgi:hypothetical protein